MAVAKLFLGGFDELQAARSGIHLVSEIMPWTAWKPFLTGELCLVQGWLERFCRSRTRAGVARVGWWAFFQMFPKSSQTSAHCVEAWCRPVALIKLGLWEPWSCRCYGAGKMGSCVATLLWCLLLGCSNPPNSFAWPSSCSCGSPAAHTAVALCPGHSGWLGSSKSKCRGRWNKERWLPSRLSTKAAVLVVLMGNYSHDCSPLPAASMSCLSWGFTISHPDFDISWAWLYPSHFSILRGTLAQMSAATRNRQKLLCSKNVLCPRFILRTKGTAYNSAPGFSEFNLVSTLFNFLTLDTRLLHTNQKPNGSF